MAGEGYRSIRSSAGPHASQSALVVDDSAVIPSASVLFFAKFSRCTRRGFLPDVVL